MPDPHPNLTRALHEAYGRALREAKYRAPYFLDLLEERYGYDTAIHLVGSSQPSLGFTNLWERGRLDLTVEALILRPEWQHLFPESILRGARKRLEDLNFDFPPDSWRPDQPPPPITPPQAPATPAATDVADAPAGRVETTIYRILRDTELARRVKVIHKYRCQVCGETITLPNGSHYAEAHHIRPLGSPHEGPDVIENIVCLCPNHHAQFDYLALKITPKTLRRAEAHPIDEGSIAFHNRLYDERWGR